MIVKFHENKWTRLVVLFILSVSTLGDVWAQEEAKIKEKQWSLFLTPDIGIMNSYYAKDVKSKANLLGLTLKYSKRNISKRHYLSYGLIFDKNTFSKDGFYDNRHVVDSEGNVNESQVRRFNVKQTYLYIAPSIEMNYLLIKTETQRVGFTGGAYFKYYLTQKSIYKLHDGVKTTVLSPLDITYNYFINNPGVKASLWYEYNLNIKYLLHLGVDYSHDLNFESPLPRFQKIGVSLGVTMKLGAGKSH